MKYRAGVDVDLTLVDTLNPWIKWFNDQSIAAATLQGGEPDIITEECYMNYEGDLVPLMLEKAKRHLDHIHTQYGSLTVGFDPMTWWRHPDLYRDLPRLPGSFSFLKNLKTHFEKNGDELEYVAVSKCEPEHERSKRQWVKTQFSGLIDGFVSTDDKHVVAMDFCFDDNPKYVIPFLENGITPIYLPWGNYENNDETIRGYCVNNPNTAVIRVYKEGSRNHFQQMSEDMDATFRNILMAVEFNKKR